MYFSPARATGVYGDIHILHVRFVSNECDARGKVKEKERYIAIYICPVLVNLLKEE
jgi:hypothetical protein